MFVVEVLVDQCIGAVILGQFPMSQTLHMERRGQLMLDPPSDGVKGCVL